MKLVAPFALGWSCACLISLNCLAQSAPATNETKSPKPRTISRLFWQDVDTCKIRWGNIVKAADWQLTPSEVEGFPKLDTAEVEFVQMQEQEGVLVTGVHDHSDGAVMSGWIAVECGVEREEHGDHFHWRFNKSPKVCSQKLDDSQGNPAHLYVYDQRFYLANDKKNGFTRLTLGNSSKEKIEEHFFNGGGGHITLAAIENRVAYATWIDRQGDNLGRVDVVPLQRDSTAGYSFHLPSGGIHGATANSGKVFFAPADGICWVTADKSASPNVTPTVNHLSLGVSAKDTPLRTGAFANHLNWVLCVAGSGSESSLCMIDAQSAKPSVTKFALPVDEGASVTTPTTLTTSKGKHYALLFQESKDHSQSEKLIVLDLDSNGDKQLGDLSVVKSLTIGASRIEGHSGHHGLTITPSRRYAFLSNPGDSSIWVLSLETLSIEAQLQVSGTPTNLVAVGG